jgi:hypothetical protein
VPIYRSLGDTAVLAKPVLELGYAPVERRDHTRWLSPHDPTLDEECDDPAHAPHVPDGDARHTALTEAPAAMLREPTDDSLVNIDDRDLGQREPVREMAS